MLKSSLNVIFLISFSAFSKEVMSSYNFLNNGLLPKGVITFGVNTGKTTSINNRYTNNGNLVTNKEYNSKALSFNDLVQSSENSMDKVLASSAFKAFGIDLSSSAGTVENDFKVNTSSQVYILGMGINNYSNLLLIVPTVNVSFDIESKFNESVEYNRLLNELERNGQKSKAQYLRDIKQAPLKTRLNENGQRLPTEINSIANIYLNYRAKVRTFISDTQLIIPYGKEYDTKEFIDFRINDNSFGLKQGIGYDFNLNKSIIGLYGTYHLRTPFQMDYRIPRNENDPLSSDIEENVRIKYGDQIDITTQYLYQWNSLFGSYINFRYLYSFKDEYDGRSFSRQRYRILEKNTESRSVSAQVGLTVNTISSFLKSNFWVPMDLNLQASKVLYGKNTFESDWVSLNLMVFYK